MKKINTEYDIGEAFAAIEDELIASMMRNISRHKAEEEKEGKTWTMWQTEQLKALEKYKKENRSKYQKQFKDLNRKIEELLRMAQEEGQMDQEAEILQAIKDGFAAEKVDQESAAEFFRLNERKLEALIEATHSDMQKAETAILRKAEDQYRKIIYNAQVYANSGAGTYEKAVDMATKDFLAAGLTCIEYKNGARHTLSDYADMAIRTASKRAYLQGEGVKRQEWGISTVIINKRGDNPCPKCLPFVGKVMIDDVWSDGPKDGKSPVTGKRYPLISSAIAAGLYHPRCRDSHTTYFEGISTPPDGKFSKKELNDLAEQNLRETRQQYADRQAGKYERLEKYSLDPKNQQEYEAKREEWKQLAVGKETSGSIEEAQKKANELGVKYALYNDLPLAMANEINDALETIPEDIRPAFVGDSATLEAYRGAKLPRKSSQFYGVHIDVPPTGVLLGRDEATGRMNYDFDIQGQMVGISKKYNTAEKITKSKMSEQKKYIEKHGNKWFFNENGKSTPYHEIGHVYEEAKGLPDGFEKDAERWAVESRCDMLKNPREAWAEAWGAYHTQNEELPEYIAKYIEQATEKPIAKKVNTGIMELTRKISDSRAGFKFISDKTFDNLTIVAKKKGAVILRGTEEVERHLDSMNAAASNLNDILFFRKDVCISEVLEETHHFEQNLMKMNEDKGEPLRSILNEIDAKQYLLDNAEKYKIPRNEIELTKKQLASYQQQLKEITEE